MKGRLRVEAAPGGFSGLRNDFSTALHRADVHGRPGAPHRMRQRREPADRARLHAPERDRRAALARRVARPARPAIARGEPGAVDDWRRDRRRARDRPDADAARVRPVGRPSDPDSRHARCAHPRVHARPHILDRDRLRPGAGAAREPARSVGDAEGHGRRDRRQRRIALLAQRARRRAGRAQFSASVRRGAVRAQSAEPEDRGHRRRDRQSRHVPALAGVERLQRAARDELLRPAADEPASVARRQVGGASAPCRFSPATSGTAACRSRAIRPRTAKTCRRS